MTARESGRIFRFGKHCSNKQNMTRVDAFTFGAIGGVPVPGFELRNAGGISVGVVALGARIVRLAMPDAHGRRADVVLGFDSPEAYLASDAYMGATCGRYGGRIRDSAFVLDGVAHRLSSNEGAHHAHGGAAGFDRRVWRPVADAANGEVAFTLDSPDGDQGYPGALSASVAYRLDDEGVLAIDMRARTDRPTVVNLLHHGYWNLAGHDAGSIAAHRLRLEADFVTPIDDALIPTGEVRRVDGTVFDFREGRPIGLDLDRVPTAAGGYDHNFCVRGVAGELRRVATLGDPGSGRMLELFSDAPGVQLYTGGHFRAEVVGKGGARYRRYAGVALETQRFPDAPNLAHFPCARLDPGRDYLHRMRVRLFHDRGAAR